MPSSKFVKYFSLFFLAHFKHVKIRNNDITFPVLHCSIRFRFVSTPICFVEGSYFIYVVICIYLCIMVFKTISTLGCHWCSRNCFRFRSTLVHPVGFLWGLCCSIFSFLCCVSVFIFVSFSVIFVFLSFFILTCLSYCLASD